MATQPKHFIKMPNAIFKGNYSQCAHFLHFRTRKLKFGCTTQQSISTAAKKSNTNIFVSGHARAYIYIYYDEKLADMFAMTSGGSKFSSCSKRKNENMSPSLSTFFPHGSTVAVGHGLLIVQVSRSHSNTSHSVGFLRTSDRPVPETST